MADGPSGISILTTFYLGSFSSSFSDFSTISSIESPSIIFLFVDLFLKFIAFIYLFETSSFISSDKESELMFASYYSLSDMILRLPLGRPLLLAGGFSTGFYYPSDADFEPSFLSPAFCWRLSMAFKVIWWIFLVFGLTELSRSSSDSELEGDGSADSEAGRVEKPLVSLPLFLPLWRYFY